MASVRQGKNFVTPASKGTDVCPSKVVRKGKAKTIPTFTCQFCGAVIRWKNNFLRHLRRLHELDSSLTAPCGECRRVFSDEHELRDHMQSVHADRGKPDATAPKAVYKCATCGGRFPSHRALQQHSHDKVTAFPCDICGRKFQTAVVRAAHRRRHFWRGLPRCRVCSATFAAEEHLSRHIRNHERESSELVRY